MPTKQNSPLPARLVAGETYSWCRCGLSHAMPLCDGSHETTDQQPLNFVAEESKIAYLCACTTTENPPLCDGSHCKVEL